MLLKLTKTLLLCAVCSVCAEPTAVSWIGSDLDGRSFSGTLKATNTWLRIGVKGQIHFADGLFYWTADGDDSEVEKLPFQGQFQDGRLFFTATGPAEPGCRDQITWHGSFDGTSVFEVRAVWQRIEKDFVHDLMLTDEVHFTFMPSTEHQLAND